MSSNHSSTLAIRDRPKPNLTNIPTEIRLITYSMAIGDRTINVFRESPSEGDNLKDKTLGNLSLAYPTLETEIEDWFESAPHLRRSLRYGIFNPETTTFVFDLNTPRHRGYSTRQLISDFCEEEFHQKSVRRVRIKFDESNKFHSFLEKFKDLLQKLKNIEFCDIEWSDSSQGRMAEAGYKSIVGWFWFGVRDLMRRCPRKVPCSCCIADPEIRLRGRDGAWKVLQPPKSDHLGWESWEIDDAERCRILFALTRTYDMFNAYMVHNNGAMIG